MFGYGIAIGFIGFFSTFFAIDIATVALLLC